MHVGASSKLALDDRGPLVRTTVAAVRLVAIVGADTRIALQLEARARRPSTVDVIAYSWAIAVVVEQWIIAVVGTLVNVLYDDCTDC
jgi:hypothetical protein